MKKVLMISTTVLVFAALGLLSRGSAALSGATQEAITGDWTAKVKQTDRGPVLWLSLNRNSDAGKGRFQMSSDFPLQDFPAALSLEVAISAQNTLER